MEKQSCICCQFLMNKSTVKVELLKPTKPKICIFMPFVDTNSHLTTKPSNFDIKCHSNCESYDRQGFFGPSLGVVRMVIYGWRFFQRKRLLWGWLPGPSRIVLKTKKKYLPCIFTHKFTNWIGDCSFANWFIGRRALPHPLCRLATIASLAVTTRARRDWPLANVLQLQQPGSPTGAGHGLLLVMAGDDLVLKF